MDDNDRVPVKDKNFIGIGKLVFDSNAEWNIPHLHFMVDKTAAGNFEATLLEFGLVSWAEDIKNAIASLTRQTHAHIISVTEKTGFDEFIREVDDHVMDDYWREYRKRDFTLAREGRDLSHEMDSRFLRAVRAMISEDTEKRIKEIADLNAEVIINAFNKSYSATLSTVTFYNLEAAA